MFGDVVTGKYQIGLNAWLWNKDRNEVVDFVVPNYIYRTILCYIPKPPEVDLQMQFGWALGVFYVWDYLPSFSHISSSKVTVGQKIKKKVQAEIK